MTIEKVSKYIKEYMTNIGISSDLYLELESNIHAAILERMSTVPSLNVQYSNFPKPLIKSIIRTSFKHYILNNNAEIIDKYFSEYDVCNSSTDAYFLVNFLIITLISDNALKSIALFTDAMV